MSVLLLASENLISIIYYTQCLKHCGAGLENMKPVAIAEMAEDTTDQQVSNDCLNSLQ